MEKEKDVLKFEDKRDCAWMAGYLIDRTINHFSHELCQNTKYYFQKAFNDDIIQIINSNAGKKVNNISLTIIKAKIEQLLKDNDIVSIDFVKVTKISDKHLIVTIWFAMGINMFPWFYMEYDVVDFHDEENKFIPINKIRNMTDGDTLYEELDYEIRADLSTVL